MRRAQRSTKPARSTCNGFIPLSSNAVCAWTGTTKSRSSGFACRNVESVFRFSHSCFSSNSSRQTRRADRPLSLLRIPVPAILSDSHKTVWAEGQLRASSEKLSKHRLRASQRVSHDRLRQRREAGGSHRDSHKTFRDLKS